MFVTGAGLFLLGLILSLFVRVFALVVVLFLVVSFGFVLQVGHGVDINTAGLWTLAAFIILQLGYAGGILVQSVIPSVVRHHHAEAEMTSVGQATAQEITTAQVTDSALSRRVDPDASTFQCVVRPPPG